MSRWTRVMWAFKHGLIFMTVYATEAWEVSKEFLITVGLKVAFSVQHNLEDKSSYKWILEVCNLVGVWKLFSVTTKYFWLCVMTIITLKTVKSCYKLWWLHVKNNQCFIPYTIYTHTSLHSHIHTHENLASHVAIQTAYSNVCLY